MPEIVSIWAIDIKTVATLLCACTDKYKGELEEEIIRIKNMVMRLENRPDHNVIFAYSNSAHLLCATRLSLFHIFWLLFRLHYLCHSMLHACVCARAALLHAATRACLSMSLCVCVCECAWARNCEKSQKGHWTHIRVTGEFVVRYP